MENFDAALDHNYGARLEPFTPSKEADLCSKLEQPEPEANRDYRLIEACLWLKMIATNEVGLLQWYFSYHNPLVGRKPGTPIPLDGLVRADHFRTSGHFDQLEVWENDSRTDSLIVGVHVGNSGYRTYFPLYRWGSTDATIAEIRSAHSLYDHHLTKKREKIKALRSCGLTCFILAIAAVIDSVTHSRSVAAIVGICFFALALFCNIMAAATRDFMYDISRTKALTVMATNARSNHEKLPAIT